MGNHTLDFHNKTDRAWTMGLYQTFSSPVDLDSVAWSLMTVAAGRVGVSGFDLSPLGLFLASYSQDGGRSVYRVEAKTLETVPGTTWQIENRPGSAFREIGRAQGREIVIRNSTGRVFTAGFGMGGSPSVYKKALESGTSLTVDPLPTIYVGLFNHLEKGEVISGNIAVGPLVLQYPRHETCAALKASVQGNETVLSLAYGPLPVVP